MTDTINFNKATANKNVGGDTKMSKNNYELIVGAVTESKYIEEKFGYMPRIIGRLNLLGLILATCKYKAFFSGNDNTYTVKDSTSEMVPGRLYFFKIETGEKMNIGGVEVVATRNKSFRQYTMEAGKWAIVYWGNIKDSSNKSNYFQLFKISSEFEDLTNWRKESETRHIMNDAFSDEKEVKKERITPPSKSSKKKINLVEGVIDLNQLTPEQIQKAILINSGNRITEA